MNKGYRALCEYIFDKNVSLIGIGVSNLPLVRFLKNAGAKRILVRDLKKNGTASECVAAKSDGAELVLGEGYLSDLNEDIIIRSPGIRPDLPAFLSAKERGARITCETELFLEFSPCKTVAVTGSDGKTTTTTLISKILEAAGYRVCLGGNIGKAMLPYLESIRSDTDVAVMELSSFQLMECQFSPDIAVITNLAENHLDWHKDMNEYLDAKENILRHQSENGVAVLNLGNRYTRNCSYNGSVVYFSSEAAEDGHYSSTINDIRVAAGAQISLINNQIVYADGTENKKILSVSDILLPGHHNVENYMAAIAATMNLVSPDAVERVAKSFGGVEHRIELIRELCGVKYYNSSIDSSPSRSTACLRAFEKKIIMIAGGYDKNLDYTALGDEICEHVKVLILCGATSEKIRAATMQSKKYKKDAPIIISCEHFDETALTAKRYAEQGDCVVLSPASASFDLFKNFEERGKRFKKIVSEL